MTNVNTYDYRENCDVICYQLDIGALNTAGLYPDNGIIYITYDQCFDPVGDIYAIMITNAGNLPQPTTIVSDLPVYIVGDFNLDWPAPAPPNSHPAAAIIADAVTILSNTTGKGGLFQIPFPTDWDNTTSLFLTGPPDTLYGPPDTLAYDWRYASALTFVDTCIVNACIMSGIVPTTASNYSGGLWNLARLLEDWGGITLTINGSLACFWESQVVNSACRFPDGLCGEPNSYYSRPILNLSYDASLTNSATSAQPPGTPRLNITVNITRSEVEEL